MQLYQGLYLLLRNFCPNIKKKCGNLFALGMVQLFQSLLLRDLTFSWIYIIFYRIGSWLFFHIDQSKRQFMYIKSIKELIFVHADRCQDEINRF